MLPIIMSATVRVDDTIGTMTAIEYQGKLWLVPAWLESRSLKISKPERMIRFDNLHHLKTPNDETQFFVSEQLTVSLVDGETTEGFEVLVEPDIEFPFRGDEPNH